MKTRLPFAIAALVLLAACKPKTEERPAATPPDVLSGVPLVTGSQLLEKSGTADAARAVYATRLPPDSVAAIYRKALAAGGWRIVGDVADQGGVDLYVEREGPPLWIQIRPAEMGATRYTLIGALGSSADQPDSGPGVRPDSVAGGPVRPPAPGGAGH